MLDDEAEEKRARWIFNLVVFFLVFAFAIDLSYMIGSLIPVGVGISLIAWRVWRTPEITNPITSHMGLRLRRLAQNFALALGPIAFIIFSVTIFATSGRSSPGIGFPFGVTREIPTCFGPGGGCYSYDPVLVALNYLFWAGLSFGILTLARWIRAHGTSR